MPRIVKGHPLEIPLMTLHGLPYDVMGISSDKTSSSQHGNVKNSGLGLKGVKFVDISFLIFIALIQNSLSNIVFLLLGPKGLPSCRISLSSDHRICQRHTLEDMYIVNTVGKEAKNI